MSPGLKIKATNCSAFGIEWRHAQSLMQCDRKETHVDPFLLSKNLQTHDRSHVDRIKSGLLHIFTGGVKRYFDKVTRS